MFQPGELLVYGTTGVCRVEGVATPNLTRAEWGRQYYLLKPLYQDGVIYTPLDSGERMMRPVMSAEDARALIAQIPTIRPEAFRERTLQLLSQRYQTLLQSGNGRDLLELTMSVYQKRRQAEKQNRRLGMVDEKYGRQAERLLFGELAVALDIPVDQVPAYISSRMKEQAFAG